MTLAHGWLKYRPEFSEPATGDYWLVVEGRVVLGERVSTKFGKPGLFRTADYGNCDDLVTHYARIERPEAPR